MLLTQAEVVEAVTALSGEYAIPITKEVRAARRPHAIVPSTSQMEESAEDPSDYDVPPMQEYPGWDCIDEHLLDLGLDNRRTLRRLEDYLALYHQSPLAVSQYIFSLFLGGVAESCCHR